MRHVAVVARRSRRPGPVVAVRLDVIGDRPMALCARGVAVAAGAELPIGIAVVHRMTRQAGERAALMTRRLKQSVVLAPRHAHHAVPPVATGGEAVVGGDLPTAGAVAQRGQRKDRLALGELLPRPEADAALQPRLRRATDPR